MIRHLDYEARPSTNPKEALDDTDSNGVDHTNESINSITEEIVELVDGTCCNLNDLSIEDLNQLQWEQETAFAKQIKHSTKGSQRRTEVICLAYQTVCKILAKISEREGNSEFAMGMDHRYTHFVLERLNALNKNENTGGLFEVGFGSGMLLQAASQNGYRVGGLEVADQLLNDAKDKLPKRDHQNLCFGNFLDNETVNDLAGTFDVVYWNDVFEHIPVDEISEYLEKIYNLLMPGGELITITPNWHMRPVDVTADHLPPRSTAIGFHLKEYKLSEVVGLLRQSGFQTVTTPSLISRSKIHHHWFLTLTRFKQWIEPVLELLPYRLAVQVCRRFGFSLTIAKK